MKLKTLYSGDNTPFLEMKKTGASGLFDDGLAYLFKDDAGEPKGIKPYHIHLEINTGSQDLETCDLRLYTVEVSTETEEEKTHETVCKGSELDSTTAGGEIEEKGRNPHKGHNNKDDSDSGE